MRISVVLTEVMAAAPKPCAVRARASAANDPASAHPAEARVKRAMPAT